jgi:hypothetical protein
VPAGPPVPAQSTITPGRKLHERLFSPRVSADLPSSSRQSPKAARQTPFTPPSASPSSPAPPRTRPVPLCTRTPALAARQHRRPTCPAPGPRQPAAPAPPPFPGPRRRAPMPPARAAPLNRPVGRPRPRAQLLRCSLRLAGTCWPGPSAPSRLPQTPAVPLAATGAACRRRDNGSGRNNFSARRRPP